MIIDVTYACNMGCSHCMSDCTPDGLHMPIQTFRDSLNFLQTYKIPTWNFSGGEMFEHPQIMEILDVLGVVYPWDSPPLQNTRLKSIQTIDCFKILYNFEGYDFETSSSNRAPQL